MYTVLIVPPYKAFSPMNLQEAGMVKDNNDSKPYNNQFLLTAIRQKDIIGRPFHNNPESVRTLPLPTGNYIILSAQTNISS